MEVVQCVVLRDVDQGTVAERTLPLAVSQFVACAFTEQPCSRTGSSPACGSLMARDSGRLPRSSHAAFAGDCRGDFARQLHDTPALCHAPVTPRATFRAVRAATRGTVGFRTASDDSRSSRRRRSPRVRYHGFRAGLPTKHTAARKVGTRVGPGAPCGNRAKAVSKLGLKRSLAATNASSDILSC